ncbi:hypothetical protein GGR52DRAFT_425117 [Hypoxylon sp. FL1284]|nr:hypothetical protein GGR52DRAFT_425117 [Hypoxylon sp. FL1284]
MRCAQPVYTAPIMFPIDFRSRHFCLQALLWSGLLFESRCDSVRMEGDRSELGVLGSPAVEYMTITITTTIAYRPTMAPGDSAYSLLGCYGHRAGDGRGGHPFGQEEDYTYASPIIPPNRLTLHSCLEGCTALRSPDESLDQYEYVGLMNGGECFCSSQFDPAARKLSPEECQSPCPGDARLACGGPAAIAVYGRAAGGGNANSGGHASGDNNKSFTTGNDKPVTGVGTGGRTSGGSIDTESRQSSTSVGIESRTAGAAEATKGTSTSSQSSTPSPTPAHESKTTSTIAAVTGSLSGAIILAALSVLCFRSYRRKKQQEQDSRAKADTQADHDKKRTSRRPAPSAIDTAADLTDAVPTTPALESGGRAHLQQLSSPGLHSRLKSPGSDHRDRLYDALMGEVRAGPAPPEPPPQPPVDRPSYASAASSAVQWRGAPQPTTPTRTPTTASAALFDFGFDRASGQGAVVSPTAAARPEAPLGQRAWHRRKLSTPFQPPASRPPSAPLPPTPPPRQQPRGPYATGESAGGSAVSLGTAGSVTPATPTMGKEGSISTVTLLRKTQAGDPGSDQVREGAGDGRQVVPGGGTGTTSTLPPITPGADPVPGQWRGATYAGPRDESDDDRSEGSRSSLSESTVATSILFPLDHHDNDDDNRTWSGA